MQLDELKKFKIKWYNFINRNNIYSLQRNTLSHEDGQLIVSYVDKNGYYWYANFRCYLDFYYKLNLLNLNDRRFSEVILGDQIQKIRLDIDIPANANIDGKKLFSLCIDALCKVLEPKVTIDLEKDILVTTSHSKVTSKLSYHVIVTNYALTNNLEVKYILEAIKSLLPEEYREFLDISVCKSIQNFRILHCVRAPKPDEDIKTYERRQKIFASEWEYNGKIIKSVINDEIEIFEASLITLTATCKIISFKIKIFKSIVSFDIKNYDIIINKFNKYCKNNNLDDIYEVANDKNGYIQLKRVHSGFCPLCLRKHESIDGYLYSKDNKVFFGCHRNSRRIEIGNIEDKNTNNITIDDVIQNNKSKVIRDEKSSGIHGFNKLKLIRQYVDVKEEVRESKEEKINDNKEQIDNLIINNKEEILENKQEVNNKQQIDNLLIENKEEIIETIINNKKEIINDIKEQIIDIKESISHNIPDKYEIPDVKSITNEINKPLDIKEEKILPNIKEEKKFKTSDEKKNNVRLNYKPGKRLLSSFKHDKSKSKVSSNLIKCFRDSKYG